LHAGLGWIARSSVCQKYKKRGLFEFYFLKNKTGKSVKKSKSRVFIFIILEVISNSRLFIFFYYFRSNFEFAPFHFLFSE